MVPLFVPGLPGGPELLIVLLMVAMYVVLPVLGIVAVYNFLDGKRGYEERITRLERRVAELEDELE
ncbi:hypothetical protein [Halopelagius longus]|uniref:Preprotein translocase subunit TatA n=1 Tax=Halopelagius longus TaxID=1236180 RepID=A0A1H1G7E3_9EURY|nr:hypothetical protein [Halopelagius longus]RDI69812.1 hypothetical protein DWB78_16815 [Halopelagius longus]SDR08828.1 hypothetical protein SAMN05216278_3554 [Halopelagius longus]